MQDVVLPHGFMATMKVYVQVVLGIASSAFNVHIRYPLGLMFAEDNALVRINRCFHHAHSAYLCTTLLTWASSNIMDSVKYLFGARETSALTPINSGPLSFICLITSRITTHGHKS